MKMTSHQEMMTSMQDCFRLSEERLRDIMSRMNYEMDKGLDSDTNAEASMKMFPSYVRALPDGTETGNYLALDLGGTNFRVLLVTINGSSQVHMKSQVYSISKDTMLGPGEELFDHIAQCIEDFIKTNKLDCEDTIPLGFTFSFPLQQRGLAKAVLQWWTKGFNCSGVIGKDVVDLLHEAMKRKGLNVECLAVINDTVGTLMSCAHAERQTRIGLILGTGTNACYLEDLEKVGMWDEDLNEPKQVIINSDWGAFGNTGEIDDFKTEFDREVDENSLNPCKQIFEKMISGMYMGELVRLVLVKMIRENKNLLGGKVSAEMRERERFYTKYVSEIESDSPTGQFEKTRDVILGMGYSDVTMDDCRIVREVCRLISERAAALASAGIAVLLNRINKPGVTVGVDGSLFRYHPHFEKLMMEKIHQLARPGLKCKLMLSADGSGKGAALVAAVAHRTKLQSRNRQPRDCHLKIP